MGDTSEMAEEEEEEEELVSAGCAAAWMLVLELMVDADDGRDEEDDDDALQAFLGCWWRWAPTEICQSLVCKIRSVAASEQVSN